MLQLHYAVLGHPIGHTMSPFIHNRLFALDGLSAEYVVMDVSPAELPDVERGILRQLDGYNLTIPLKTAILPLLDRLDGKARLYGSVNTVKNGAIRTGYSTDPFGFCGSLKDAGIPLSGRTVVIGCGGAARVMVFEAVISGAEVVLAVRDSGLIRAETLAEDARKVVPDARITVCSLNTLNHSVQEIDLLVNATPVGMFPNIGECPVAPQVLSRTRAVFDAIYNPQETVLMRQAAACGATVCGGMRMLVLQAAQAHRIWHGATYQKDDIDLICAEASEELKRKFPPAF